MRDLCGYQRPSRGVDPRGTHGQPTGNPRAWQGICNKKLPQRQGHYSAFAFLANHPWGHTHGICTWSAVVRFSGNSSQGTEDKLIQWFLRVRGECVLSLKFASVIKPSSNRKWWKHINIYLKLRIKTFRTFCL